MEKDPAVLYILINKIKMFLQLFDKPAEEAEELLKLHR